MADLSSYTSISSAMDAQLASRANAVQQTVATTKEDAKIDKAGHDFESLLLTSWLQEAEQSFATVPGTDEEEESDSGKQQYMSLGMEALGKAMAASGGVGIAKMITSQLHKSEEKEDAKADNTAR